MRLKPFARPSSSSLAVRRSTNLQEVGIYQVQCRWIWEHGGRKATHPGRLWSKNTSLIVVPWMNSGPCTHEHQLCPLLITLTNKCCLLSKKKKKCSKPALRKLKILLNTKMISFPYPSMECLSNMSVSLRLIYKFEMIPIQNTTSCLYDSRKLILEFLWKNRHIKIYGKILKRER